MFYATRPGDVANEYHDADDAVKNHKGIFSECLLEALNGREKSVVRELEGDEVVDGVRYVIPSRPLKRYLLDAVPRRAEDVHISLNQRPEINVGSGLPDYFGKLDELPMSTRAPAAPESSPDLRHYVGVLRDVALDIDEDVDDAVIDTAVTTADAARFLSQMRDVASATGRDHYETTTGFSVTVPVREITVTKGQQSDLFEDNGQWHIRVTGIEDQSLRSVLVEFENGDGVVLGVLRGYIGTALVEDSQLINVSYTPSSNTDEYHEYEYAAKNIERRRAFAATASRHGVFDVEDGDDAGNYLRMGKAYDPTMGVYAAYAYSQAGRLDKVRSVLSYVPGPWTPYDILLLARDETAWNPRRRIYAPFCPMLRQGWMLLDLNPTQLARLAPLRAHLRSSLWTQLTPEGVALVKDHLSEGLLV